MKNPTYKELIAFVNGVAKCGLGANGQFNLVIENARELAEKSTEA